MKIEVNEFIKYHVRLLHNFCCVKKKGYSDLPNGIYRVYDLSLWSVGRNGNEMGMELNDTTVIILLIGFMLYID